MFLSKVESRILGIFRLVYADSSMPYWNHYPGREDSAVRTVRGARTVFLHRAVVFLGASDCFSWLNGRGQVSFGEWSSVATSYNRRQNLYLDSNIFKEIGFQYLAF